MKSPLSESLYLDANANVLETDVDMRKRRIPS